MKLLFVNLHNHMRTYVHTVCGMYALPSHHALLPPHFPSYYFSFHIPPMSSPFLPMPPLFPTVPLPLLSHAPSPSLQVSKGGHPATLSEYNVDHTLSRDYLLLLGCLSHHKPAILAHCKGYGP